MTTLGYCCISNLNPKLKCSQASTLKWLTANPDKARAKLLEKAKSNLHNLEKLLHANYANNILAFRIPEQLLPQADLGYYSITEFAYELNRIGTIANKYNMQISQHPSQYFVLNSKRADVVDKTISNLNLFADILSLMNLNLTPNLTIHVGAKGGYSGTEALDAFCDNFARLNSNAQSYLVVENDQNSFTVQDCLYIHNRIGIPVVLDSAHHAFNSTISLSEAVSLVLPTWGNRIPKFHLSSEDSQPRHAHADNIELSDYLALANAIGDHQAIIMLECKNKDEALLQLRSIKGE